MGRLVVLDVDCCVSVLVMLRAMLIAVFLMIRAMLLVCF